MITVSILNNMSKKEHIPDTYPDLNTLKTQLF